MVLPRTILVLALAVAVSWGLPACGATAGPAVRRAVEIDPAPRSIAADDAAVARLRGSDRCILASIVRIGPSPGVWSGFVATFQPVVLRVERRLDAAGKGWPQPGDEAPVWFGIVGAPDCDPDEPRLDPRIYRVGVRGVVGAEFGRPCVGGPATDHLVSLRATTSFHETGSDDPAGVVRRVTEGRAPGAGGR